MDPYLPDLEVWGKEWGETDWIPYLPAQEAGAGQGVPYLPKLKQETGSGGSVELVAQQVPYQPDLGTPPTK